MTEHDDLDRDLAMLRQLIEGSDAGLAGFMAERPYLRSADEARDDLASLIEGLEDVRAGRVVPHAQIVADAEERHARYRTQAAE